MPCSSGAAGSGCFVSLRQLHNEMEPAHFGLIVYNVVVGNQCIVRGVDANVVASVLVQLARLVPAACCTILCDQQEYHESYECNFLVSIVLGFCHPLSVVNMAAVSRHDPIN